MFITKFNFIISCILLSSLLSLKDFEMMGSDRNNKVCPQSIFYCAVEIRELELLSVIHERILSLNNSWLLELLIILK